MQPLDVTCPAMSLLQLVLPAWSPASCERGTCPAKFLVVLPVKSGVEGLRQALLTARGLELLKDVARLLPADAAIDLQLHVVCLCPCSRISHVLGALTQGSALAAGPRAWPASRRAAELPRTANQVQLISG